MSTISSLIVPTWSFSRAALLAALAACCASGCAVYDDSPQYARTRAPAWNQPSYPYAEPDGGVYVEPPLYEPAPIAVPWAPPPLQAEMVPPRPFPDAVWVGGYWVWQGRWVWATGRWAPRPRPDYAWVQPYYEHRDGAVIFITGHWRPPGVAFVPPPPGFRPRVMAPGVRPGAPPVGPPGVFMPPPPGSRPGLIGPAPVGTPPPVVRGVPPQPTPRQAEALPPPGRPSWRGAMEQAVPHDPPRERSTPRDEGVPVPRGRDRGQERPPGEFQRRPTPVAPTPAAPPTAVQPATPAPAAAAGGAPPPRRDEGPRRGPRGDRDKKDPKNE